MQTYSRTTIAIIILISSPVLFLNACEEDKKKETEELTTLEIIWIPKELGNRVFETGRDGALAKAKELSALGDYNVNITYAGPESAADVKGQAALVKGAVSQEFDAVAISCNTPDGLKSAIDEVAVAGLPVMTFDSDSPDSARFTYLGVDNEVGGRIAAQILGESMSGGQLTKVALVSGVQGAANLEARITGFEAEITQNYPSLEIVKTVYCDDNADLSATLIEQTLTEHPDLGGFFFVGLWPLFVCEGTDCSASMPLWDTAAKSGDLKTVVFDTLEFQLDFVAANMVSGLVGQKYWGWGYDAVQMIYDHIVNKKNYAPWTDSGIDVVCPNNVSEMDAMWLNTNFTTPLTPCVINNRPIQ